MNNFAHAITGLETWQEGSSLGALNTPICSPFRRLSAQSSSVAIVNSSAHLCEQLTVLAVKIAKTSRAAHFNVREDA
jgi:hypothetical protein